MLAQQVAEMGQNLGKTQNEPEIDQTSIEAPESPGVPKGGDI